METLDKIAVRVAQSLGTRRNYDADMIEFAHRLVDELAKQKPVALTDEMYEEILQEANRTFLHYRHSVRGQTITNLDNADFHIAAAAIKLFAAPVTESKGRE